MTSVSQLNLTSCLGLPSDPPDCYKGNKRLHLHEHKIQWLNKRLASSFQNNLYIVKITKMLFCADVFCPSLDDYQFIIFWFCCSFDSHVRSVLIISTIQLIYSGTQFHTFRFSCLVIYDQKRRRESSSTLNVFLITITENCLSLQHRLVVLLEMRYLLDLVYLE